MDLNKPVFDSVLAIDAQLQKLQSEVTSMDAEFANYKPQQLKGSPEISEEVGEPRKVSFASAPKIHQS